MCMCRCLRGSRTQSRGCLCRAKYLASNYDIKSREDGNEMFPSLSSPAPHSSTLAPQPVLDVSVPADLIMAVLPTAALAQTAPDMTVNSTLSSPKMLGWVSSSGYRSTWEIIINCLSIFVLCSWRCMHLNLPLPTEAQEKLPWRRFSLSVRGYEMALQLPTKLAKATWTRKLKWMAVICLAPEVGVGVAFSQWQNARNSLHQSRTSENGLADIPFSRTHAFFADMGGIEIRSYEIVEADHGSSPDNTAAPEHNENTRLGQTTTSTKRFRVISSHVATLGEAYSSP